ncbi:MAG: ABC transporter ATP-binding protein, partial [Hyphomicrobiales bacterium]|nr:ABC transporter ATP-binding protein [Hyphomicrobiales bacterium]
MTDIRFEAVSKRYADSVEVIRDLNLHVADGELMVLVGPSGCAKSTTLRMIAGLESISAGDLWIGGDRANRLPPAERNISMVFQSYALFPNMTVRGNLSFGMQIRKQSRSDTEREVGRVADMLGLSPLLDRRPRQLSGGQAQRVALGRAMIRRPSAFLFDEPLSNLDAELRVQMRGEISQMQKAL